MFRKNTQNSLKDSKNPNNVLHIIFSVSIYTFYKCYPLNKLFLCNKSIFLLYFPANAFIEYLELHRTVHLKITYLLLFCGCCQHCIWRPYDVILQDSWVIVLYWNIRRNESNLSGSREQSRRHNFVTWPLSFSQEECHCQQVSLDLYRYKLPLTTAD